MSKPKGPIASDRQPGPACVRVRGVRCRCFECRCYLTEAHVVRGVRGAFCSHCCPACNSRPPQAAGGGPHAA
jgi:hypothetical protein